MSVTNREAVERFAAALYGYGEDDLPELIRDVEEALAIAGLILSRTPPPSDEATLQLERDFLLARSKAAGSCSFSLDRWTGMSSNALVEVAFGETNDCLPGDGQDLAACYRTVMRLPAHLRTDAVAAQLERGESNVDEGNLAWAREVTKWPGIAALNQPEQET